MVIRVSAQFFPALAIVLTIGCDRVTSVVATAALAGTAGHSFLADTVRLQYAENTGGFPAWAATSIRRQDLGLRGGDRRHAAEQCAAIRWRIRGVALLGLTLFVAGGASNWIDRLASGLSSISSTSA